MSLPSLGLGTFRLKQRESKPAIAAALSSGYRLIDTARMYRNEDVIGAALAQAFTDLSIDRSDVFIQSKVHDCCENVTVAEALSTTLEHLRLQYLDCYLVHYPCSLEDIANKSGGDANAAWRKDVWRQMEAVYDKGLVKAIGVSNYEISHLEELLSFCRIRPFLNQCEFHPHFTRDELRAFCARELIHFQAHSPLAKCDARMLNDATVLSLAERNGVTAQTLLLSFANACVDSVVVKSRKPDRIASNISTLLTLSASDIETLSGLNTNYNYSPCTGWLVS